MSHEVPSDVWMRLEAFVETGEYTSEADVLRDAVSALERRRHELASIEAGLADVDAGRVKSLEDFDRDFRKRHNLPAD